MVWRPSRFQQQTRSGAVRGHRLMDWFGLGGTLEIIWSQPPARSRDISHQPRVLRAPSNLALSPAREGAATVSLGSLGQGLTTLLGKNFFPISDLNLPSVSSEPFPLVPSLHPLGKSPSPNSSKKLPRTKRGAQSCRGRGRIFSLSFACFHAACESP